MINVVEYLAEVTFDQAERLLKSAISNAYTVQVKLSGEDKILSIVLQKSDNKNRILLSGKLFKIHLATFKVEIGPDVYFFKTEILQEDKISFIQKPFKVFRLIRRKEPRYKIPKAWSHLALILATQQMKLNSRADIVEFSASGIRLHALSDLLRVDQDEIIRIQFRIHKRAEITVSGLIRHIRRNRAGGFTLGIEFVKVSGLTQMKIQNVCDDLIFHYTHTTKITHK